MKHFVQLASLVIFLAATSSADKGRWSRQISSYTADISDWVPLPGPVEREPPLPPIKRQAIAEPRILSEPFPGLARPSGFSAEFPSRNFYSSPNRQLYLQSVPSVPSAPQNYLSEQGFGQSIRFGLSQPNFPLNQGFVSHQFGYDGIPQIKPRPIPQPALASPVNFPKPAPQQIPNLQKFNVPNIPNVPKPKPEVPKYIDGYRAENASNDYALKKPVSLQKMNYDKIIKQENGPINKVEKEEVQLLYVPLESLNRGQFNFRNPLGNSQFVNSELYGTAPRPLKQAAQESQIPIQKPSYDFQSQEYFKNYNSQRKDVDQVPKFSTINNPFNTIPPTTPKPKKLKPHQPPLAIFITEEASKNDQIKVGDVLGSLKNADSIAVLDSVNPLNAPKVFIGPSSLQPPERYVKFDLPYLSNIEHSDKKLRQLPFFVAPLSYNTPQGFAKIPFPSPHVGSVIINSQIRETSTHLPSTENVKPNYFAGVYKQEPPATQKPMISFYSTTAPQNKVPNYQSNYYSFEPQTVSTLRPIKESEIIAHQKPSNYFLNNMDSHYDITSSYQQQAPIQAYTTQKKDTTTHKPIVPSTTKPPTTYPNQLLETHNPYSINHAFHFSTPLDYHSYFEDVKQPVATPGTEMNPPQTPQPIQTTSTAPPKIEEEVVTEKSYQEQTPYLQNYNPEIHYESEGQNNRYSTYNTNEYNKPETVNTYAPIIENTQQINNQEYSTANDNTQQQAVEQTLEELKPTAYEVESIGTNEPQTDTHYDSGETKTTSTTTRRTPQRTRGRPRYTTTPRSSGESGEYTTKTPTRRPLRERRPLPSRSKYEPNKITSEKSTRKPIDYSGESTTKSTSRTRSRGRVQFKPTESDELYNNKKSSKEQDLAYQRDVLHQNYPVTLMERMSTVDIEAITEPTFKTTQNRNSEPATENYDTENAYTNEKASVSQYSPNPETEEAIYPPRTTVSQTETPYVPKLSTRNEEYYSRDPVEPIAQTTVRDEDSYPKQTTAFQRDVTETEYATEPSVSINDQKGLSYSVNKESYNAETTIATEETTKVSQEEEEEENIVQTTPSYNRVRVRPGVIRQYHQASSTESSRTKSDRRRPVTYRPAFDRRRTTMRIDEIEADLKTKQVHARPEVQDYRHPVYKPDPTTEAPATQESATKRGQFRRRRPNYSYSTSTEGTATKKNTYEVKNRFRGRRPTTEKPTEKTETQTEASTTTVRPVYNRYSPRPRLSERYKKPEPEVTEDEDQDSNYSFNRPKYVNPEEQWSPKINSESFKPYNPNNIAEESKSTTERRSDRLELDIITARNEFEDILVSVTPASNNRNNKKIPEIPPTLEALVEQSKVTQSENDKMSTFETMLEEVMKSLEEQDENEYSSQVMKHKGGEIGEIPPERIISSGDGYVGKTTPLQHETTTAAVNDVETTTPANEEDTEKKHRRGFWKKVKVRPVTTESIEVAESQYYVNTVNRLGEPIKQSNHDKTKNVEKKVTTYKPALQFLEDIFSDEENIETAPSFDISKVKHEETTVADREIKKDNTSPGDFDLGTGSPDPTIDDIYTTTEPTTVKSDENPYSFMDFLFGTSEDKQDAKNETIEITTEEPKSKIVTTEVSYIPEEIIEDQKNSTEKTTSSPIESTSISAFMSPGNVVSTSMSTEVSHETEICFRGKCIKTSKNVL